MDERAEKRVVVGVDGSEGSYGALLWAAEYAQATGGRITAVSTWELPTSYGFYLAVEDMDLEETTRQVVQEQVAKVLEQYPDVPVDIKIVRGPAAPALVAESKEADLLVVGCRGRGGFSGLLLGSVSTHCVHSAGCPVVVCR